MSKRACASSSSDWVDTTPKRRQPEHHYSTDLHTLCLSLLSGQSKSSSSSLPAMSVADLADYRGAPSASVLYEWKASDRVATSSSSSLSMLTSRLQHDHASKLTSNALDIVGGFMLWRIKVHRPPHQDDIIDFVRTAFDIIVTDSWVTRHAHELGFRSRRPQSLAIKYAKAVHRFEADKLTQRRASGKHEYACRADGGERAPLLRRGNLSIDQQRH